MNIHKKFNPTNIMRRDDELSEEIRQICWTLFDKLVLLQAHRVEMIRTQKEEFLRMEKQHHQRRRTLERDIGRFEQAVKATAGTVNISEIRQAYLKSKGLKEEDIPEEVKPDGTPFPPDTPPTT